MDLQVSARPTAAEVAWDEVAGVERILPPARAREATRRHFLTHKRRKPLLIDAFQHFDLLTIGLLQKVSAIDHRYIDESGFLHCTERFGRRGECKLQGALREPCLNNRAAFRSLRPEPVRGNH